LLCIGEVNILPKKKSPKIALLKYCQPAVLKSRSLRLETLCSSLRGGLKKRGGK